MNRLTYKELMSGYYPNEDVIDTECFDKLGKLEDIEEEIGCPLDVIFKAQKQNKIYYQFCNEIQEWNNIKIDIRKMVVRFAWQSQLNKYASEIPLSKYGLVWWLKEDKTE